MTEDFLYHIWKNRLFRQTGHHTAMGESIVVVDPGERNMHSGPDFFNARIRIGDTVWAGNVEIHVRASDWHRHKHKGDPAYDQVLLHVVFYDDMQIFRSDGKVMPMLILKNAIADEQLRNLLVGSQDEQAFVPCGMSLKLRGLAIEDASYAQQVEQRLQRRYEEIASMLSMHRGDLEACFFEYLARAMGAKVNAEPFGQLARAFSVVGLLRQRGNLQLLESFLFGMAGMLDKDYQDLYPCSLQQEFRFQQMKHQLVPMPYERWRFMRLRPVNFPTLRIAQLATMLHQEGALYNRCMSCESADALIRLFDVVASSYWDDHFVFDKMTTKAGQKRMGLSAIHGLIINAVVPFLYFQGKYQAKPALCNRAIRMLQALTPEHNRLLKNWGEFGVRPKNAFESQALLELYSRSCKFKKCLTCSIGKQLILKSNFRNND